MAVPKPGVPEDVRRFILTSIPSVPYVEALLLMRKSPGQPWTVQRLARELYSTERQAGELLQQLEEAGVASRSKSGPPELLYQPMTAELAAKLDALADCYKKNLMAVTDLIHSRIDRRAQRFADAFRWRKDE
ncbi:MAG TPA: hypothetical protein VK996_11270 [Ramlibacter sp.]|nr:hypothetical protein [Ramlibacter sp.]